MVDYTLHDDEPPNEPRVGGGKRSPLTDNLIETAKVAPAWRRIPFCQGDVRRLR